jgi:hypothetical protein
MTFPKIDKKKLETAIIIIALGVSLRAALSHYLNSNIEPVLALSLLAGLILGSWYALAVPLVMMVLSDWLVYALDYGDLFGWRVILGISFFTWTGMLLAGAMGRVIRPKFLFRLKGVAVFTGVALVVTIIYDVWTMVGYMLVLDQPLGVTLTGQIEFSIYHILSTLVFAPLFGTIYIYVHEYGDAIFSSKKHKSDVPDDNKR